MNIVHYFVVVCCWFAACGWPSPLEGLVGSGSFRDPGTMAEQASRKRAACRGWVTRASHALEKLLVQDRSSRFAVELTDCIEQFDRRLANLDAAQDEYELTLDATETDAFDAAIEDASVFRDNARKPRIQATSVLMEVCGGSSGGRDGSEGTQGSLVDVKLPKIQLPSFSGDVTEWQTFWDQYEATIDKSELPVISKFTYLRSLLKGEALQCIQGLSMTALHYSSACDILKERYGRKERIIFAHVQALLNVTVSNKSTVSSLRKVYDELQGHVRSLAALEIDGKQYGVILTPLILSRLPADIRLEWARDGSQHESDLDFLLKFLESEIQRRERSQVYRESPVSSGSCAAEARSAPPKLSTAAALQTSSKQMGSGVVTCNFCLKQGHRVDRCYQLVKVPITERRDKLQTAGLCYRCLAKGHIARGCSAFCARCSGRHHQILCIPQGNDSNSATSKKGLTASNIPALDASKPDPSVSNSDAKVALHSHSGVLSDPFPPDKPKVPHLRVLLQIARVTACGNRDVTGVTVLIDTGSDRSYISESLIRRLEPEWVEAQNVSYAPFGSRKAGKSEWRNIYQVHLMGNCGSSHSLFVTEVPNICVPIYRRSVPEQILQSLGDLEFAEGTLEEAEVTPDILIGLDSYWKFIKPKMVASSPGGLFAQDSVFGWILFGAVPAQDGLIASAVSHQLLCFDLVSDQTVSRFWDLDAVGILDQAVDDPVLAKFRQDIMFEQGRYQVSLPWKEGAKQRLQNNEKLARARLGQLSRKLARDPALKVRYDAAISDMVTAGFIEEIPKNELQQESLRTRSCENSSSGPVFYLPHRPVVREASVSTKVRPVFDASAKGYNQVSLNDCMEVGPCLLTNLTEILIRFRRWKFAVTGDIEKAFLQIKVQRQDCDVHRFFWEKEGQVRVMRFTRVPFGNCSSPFLLNATVRHHLSTVDQSWVVQELQDNLYCDDLISGADTEEQGCELVTSSSTIMDSGGFPLGKWSSNSKVIAALLQRQFIDKYLTEDSLKVLGMKWLASLDCFTFDGISLSEGLCVTKRVVLSFVARLFDPLGFATPFTMQAKCLFQDLWRLDLKWDEEIPAELQKLFLTWMADLVSLQDWQIPRPYTSIGWHKIQSVQLHGFGDASPKGYGACIYLRAELMDGSVETALVISKARVAPLKEVSLPRLELLASVLCARLLDFVRHALKLPDVDYRCWTDSQVALCWIQSDSLRWKLFVANRVREIQRLTASSKWSYCPGSCNPADLVTRGLSASELVQSALWLQGPEFLVSSAGSIVVDFGDEFLEPRTGQACALSVSVEAQQESAESALTVVERLDPAVFEVSRWGTLSKALRIVGWVNRFLVNLRVPKTGRQSGDLSVEELEKAKLTIIQQGQRTDFLEEFEALSQGKSVSRCSKLFKLSPSLDEQGLIRVSGRLQFSSLAYAEKHPIILANTHLALLLVRFQHTLLKHAGVVTMVTSLRNEYWILGLRRLAKKVKKGCISCQRQDALAGSRPMAPLPHPRVQQTVPFGVTGLDHAGPLYCCDHVQKKFWILLFTCAVTRAVHLELVGAMTTSETMLAFRRLAARRGLPHTVYSDNAKGFTATPGQLQKHFGPSCPKWKLIAPKSPWWGGWWERLVRSVKSALKKSVGSKSLTRSELDTTLVEIEACVNSRPLTFVGDEVDALEPLTPSHFLLGRSGGFVPSASAPPATSAEPTLLQRYAILKQVLSDFWVIWTSEYIRNLPPCTGTGRQGDLKVGSVVLVHDEMERSRLKWPLGVVIRVFPGRDGVVRTAEVKTRKGVFVRSIQRLHDLEVSSGDPGDVPNTADGLDRPLVPSHPDKNGREDSSRAVHAVDKVSSHADSVPPVRVTRKGRQVKAPDILQA